MVLCYDSAFNYMIVVWDFFLVLFLEELSERSKRNEVLVLQHLAG